MAHYSFFDADLKVNGICYSLSKVYPFYQSEPFPGDGTYALAINLPNLNRRFFDSEVVLHNGIYKYPRERICRDIFMRLEILIGESGLSILNQDGKYSFFLNSIDEVRRQENDLYIEGICSTII